MIQEIPIINHGQSDTSPVVGWITHLTPEAEQMMLKGYTLRPTVSIDPLTKAIVLWELFLSYDPKLARELEEFKQGKLRS